MKTYSTHVIQKACRMFRKGAKIKDILKETGIKNHVVIYWHCDPKKRASQIERGSQWRKKNPERWKAIARKASAKFYEKHGKA